MAAKLDAQAPADVSAGDLEKIAAVEAPAGFTDYVIRFRKPGQLMRSQVVRVRSEAEATERALSAIQTGNWQGWALMDISTVEESVARYRGVR